MTTIHHALVVHSFAVACEPVSDFVVGEVVEIVHERLGIGEVRQLTERAYIRPANDTHQTLVVRTDALTLEAQNALLKLLEEPPSSTSIVLVVPQDQALIDTVKSRCVVREARAPSEGDSNSVFVSFLSAPYKDRLAAIEAAQKKRDTAWQRQIKQGLLQYLSGSTMPHYAELVFVAERLLTRGAGNKMLLEHAALLLPLDAQA